MTIGSPSLSHVAEACATPGMVGLIEALATRSFCSALLRALNACIRIDKCAIMRITRGSGLQMFGAETLSPASRGRHATAAYMDHYHRLDPNRRILDMPSPTTVLVQRQTAGRVANRGYRRACYEEPGILDRVSFVLGEQDSLVVLNLYRENTSTEFGGYDMDVLTAQAPLFGAAAARHVSLLLYGASDPAAWRERLTAACPELTGRELDVAASLLAGRTLREASATLGIAHSTVVTYRERAYARVGVANLKELRALFAR